jgi:glycine betaine/proline transport system ATP-binding protein
LTAAAPGTTGAAAKLACRGVWKLFGPDPERFLATDPTPTPEALRMSGHVAAVIDASISVAEGECFVIMGLSGSGKSTLIRCLSRLVEPSAGEIAFEGRDLRRVAAAPPRWYLDRITLPE